MITQLQLCVLCGDVIGDEHAVAMYQPIVDGKPWGWVKSPPPGTTITLQTASTNVVFKNGEAHRSCASWNP